MGSTSRFFVANTRAPQPLPFCLRGLWPMGKSSTTGIFLRPLHLKNTGFTPFLLHFWSKFHYVSILSSSKSLRASTNKPEHANQAWYTPAAEEYAGADGETILDGLLATFTPGYSIFGVKTMISN